ncbi:4-hydroxy-tetrahydrodipicolinate synthase [Thermosipho ferrireducens]|uniref:4-hydroxy-tetrahydrodipicolinate synthase n=1 Tax=Thermosipho ferrireducens TaxID=2571116 RepID=A0ABX7S9X7_9BACT|nr:4-hydroxy-tetrahydrodipicolinate synthase [Thermosipho ferrireducens]QTA38783.1 4-hydroxy-tetrahydrodipicolinate synthase [Thermosipho ferrireducens]
MFRGIGTAIVTPFKNGELDMKSYENLLKFQIENGIKAIIVLGTTGEAPNIEMFERIKLIEKAIEICEGKADVIVGAGTNSLNHTMELVKNAEKMGVNGLLIVTPYYNKPTQRGLYEYYKYISQHTDLDIIVYNVPGRTGVNILPETVYQIASECKNVKALKEANSNINQINEDIKLLKENLENFKVYSGNDDSAFQLLCTGGDGVISVASNVIPAAMVKMFNEIKEGNIKRALEIHMKYLPLFKNLFIETNPIPVKAALSLMGLIDNELRLPLVPASENTIDILKKTLKGCDVI